MSELHREGLRFQCTPSLLWSSSSSRRLSPDHCPSTRDCQSHCRHSNSQSRSCNKKDRSDEQKWIKVFPSSGRRRVGKALFQARNRFHITVHPVKIARSAGEYTSLQNHGLTQFRTRVTGWNGAVRVSTFCARRRRQDSVASPVHYPPTRGCPFH